MKWKKLGQIFNPFDFELNNDDVGFAKSPQAIVFDDFVRVYYSAAKKDNVSKILCYIKYVDFDKEFKKILNISNHKVVPLGKLGCFDEHGIFPFSPIRYKDKIYAYTSGINRRVSVSVDSSIGLAISSDNGDTFQKVGDGPVLTVSLNEPFLVIDGLVKIYDGIFHMWYIAGTEWKKFDGNSEPDRTYKIKHATSLDGINWMKEDRSIISDKFDNESQALPTIIYFGNKYHMFFCYRNSFDFRTNKNNGYRISYAYSADLTNWTRDDSQVGIDVSENGWDSEMMCYPNVFELNDKIYMLYNGNEFGKYGFGLAVLENDDRI